MDDVIEKVFTLSSGEIVVVRYDGSELTLEELGTDEDYLDLPKEEE